MSRRLSALFLALALAGLGPAATPRAAADDDPVGSESQTVFVDEQDTGSRVELRRGDRLVATLSCRAGTGFSWVAAAPLPAFLELESDEILDAEGDPGGEEFQQLVYLVNASEAAPEGLLLLHYQQRWDHETPPAARFELTLVRLD